jgi:hypothetical protein
MRVRRKKIGAEAGRDPAKRDVKRLSPRDGAQPYTSETEDYEGRQIDKPNNEDVDRYRDSKK